VDACVRRGQVILREALVILSEAKDPSVRIEEGRWPRHGGVLFDSEMMLGLKPLDVDWLEETG
jgi:hypothetical protein